MDDVHLIVFTNGMGRYVNKSEGPGKPYVPVFADVYECDKLVKRLRLDHRDRGFLICSFDSLVSIDKKIQKEFQEPIKMVIREAKKK